MPSAAILHKLAIAVAKKILHCILPWLLFDNIDFGLNNTYKLMIYDKILWRNLIHVADLT